MSHGGIEKEIIGMRLRGMTYREIEELTGMSRTKINKIWKGYKKVMGFKCKPKRAKRPKGVCRDS